MRQARGQIRRFLFENHKNTISLHPISRAYISVLHLHHIGLQDWSDLWLVYLEPNTRNASYLFIFLSY